MSDSVENVEVLGEPKDPNQLLIEMLKKVDHINELVVIVRDKEGRLDTIWTDQDLACVSEAAVVLLAAVQHVAWNEHSAEPIDKD